MPFGNVFEKINSEYHQLAGAEEKVTDYMVIHQQKTQFMSIFKLAEKANMMEVTIPRFYKQLDYKGYSAFKLVIADSTARRVGVPAVPGETWSEDSTEELCQKLCAVGRDVVTQAVELIHPNSIRKMVDPLFSAERVLYMRRGGTMILTQECARLLSAAWPNLYAVLDSHMQATAASHLTARNVVLYFSHSDSTEKLLKDLRIIRDRGVMAILVTRFPKSPGAAHAGVVFQCGSLEGLLQDGSVAARIAQLYLMDVLFHEVCRRDMQGSVEAREAVAEVLSNRYI